MENTVTDADVAKWVRYGIALAELRAPNFTQKVLVVSTCHVPEKTNEALSTMESHGLCFLSTDEIEFGHLIYVTDDKVILRESVDGCEKCGHTELGKLIALAAANGFNLLRLDRDGAILPEILGFATFNW